MVSHNFPKEHSDLNIHRIRFHFNVIIITRWTQNTTKWNMLYYFVRFFYIQHLFQHIFSQTRFLLWYKYKNLNFNLKTLTQGPLTSFISELELHCGDLKNVGYLRHKGRINIAILRTHTPDDPQTQNHPSCPLVCVRHEDVSVSLHFYFYLVNDILSLNFWFSQAKLSCKVNNYYKH